MHPLLQSSKDASQISRTVKGAAVTVLGAIVSLAVAFGVDPSALPGDQGITEIAKVFGQVAGAGSIIVGGVIHLYGVLAKVWNSINDSKI